MTAPRVTASHFDMVTSLSERGLRRNDISLPQFNATEWQLHTLWHMGGWKTG
jgi:hypothetical protein